MTIHVMARVAGVAFVGALVALSCFGSAAARAADGAPGLRVDYDPPRLSVDARGVSLARVLGEIGAKVGFTVVDNGASSPLVNVSIQDASVDEVLRRLLRGENHAVLYQAGSGNAPRSVPAIDKVVLLGEAGQMTASAERGDRTQAQPRPADVSDGQHVASVAGSPTVPPSAGPWPKVPEPLPPGDQSAEMESPADPSSPPVTVGDILKNHALAAARAAQEAADGQSADLSVPPSAPPANLQAVLIEATRRAQQSLSALIDGLATATRSLQESGQR